MFKLPRIKIGRKLRDYTPHWNVYRALGGGKESNYVGKEAKQQDESANYVQNLASSMTGQDAAQTGKDTQYLKSLLQSDIDQGADNMVSEGIRAQASGARAATQGQLRRSGVKGPMASMAMGQADRQSRADVARSLMDQRQRAVGNMRDLVSGVGSTQAGLATEAQRMRLGIPQQKSILGSLFS